VRSPFEKPIYFQIPKLSSALHIEKAAKCSKNYNSTFTLKLQLCKFSKESRAQAAENLKKWWYRPIHCGILSAKTFVNAAIFVRLQALSPAHGNWLNGNWLNGNW